MLSIEQLKAISGCAKIRPGAVRASSSPGVPSPVVSQERSLPKELWVHALEYASLDEAFAAFDVSKAFRSASRFALNKGRWAPVVKAVLAIKSFPWRQYGFAKQKHVDQVQAEFCAAWHGSAGRGCPAGAAPARWSAIQRRAIALDPFSPGRQQPRVINNGQ